MVEHNTELDEEGKKYLPEGMPLSVDRLFDANKITDDINEWKDKTNRMDLRHFDTIDAQEPKPKDIVKGITGRTSGEQVLESEPDRLVSKGVAGERLAKYKEKIINFETFKKAIESAWASDPSLKNLWEEVKGSKDDVFMSMYNENIIQKWLADNNKDSMISYLMKRYNVEKGRAERLYTRLPVKRKKTLLNLIISKQGKVKVVKKKVPKMPKTIRIRQVSRGGTTYLRSKPSRFTELQIDFLLRRQNRPLARIHEEYNSRFPNYRTESSLRNKLYRSR